MRKKQNTGTVDESRVEFTVYGMRIEEEAGWHVMFGGGNLRDIPRRREAEGAPPGEYIEIVRGWAPRNSDLDDSIHRAWIQATSRNWIVNPETDFWCSPADSLEEPDGLPIFANSLAVTFGPPMAGRMLLQLRAGGKIVDTFVHHPHYYHMTDLLTWLEDMVEGRYKRVVVKEEEACLVLAVYPADEDWIRLSALRLEDRDLEQSWCLDVLLGKRELVGAFYRALRAVEADVATFEREGEAQKETGSSPRPRTGNVESWVFSEHFSIEDYRFRTRPIESTAVEEYLRSKR